MARKKNNIVKIKIKQNNGDIRKIGKLYQDKNLFVSRRKKSKHLYRKLNAWGIDEKAFNGMIDKYNLEHIKIIDIENNKVYITNVKNFLEYGKYLHFKPYRKQLFLPLKYWSKEEL